MGKKMGKKMRENRLEFQQYQTILRLTHTIAFEFAPQSGANFVSPFISEILAGNYDDCQLSQAIPMPCAEYERRYLQTSSKENR